MGVPAFFRYLSTKYPKIMKRCVEQLPRNGIPVDPSQPNPNEYEFDNLYLDMNGLIHPCTHPEGEEAPETEADMYLVIFRYLDRILNLVRPRKLIYMAIDGVAPRAKMNQQRSRRFRSAQEAAEAEEDAERVRQEMISMGLKPPSKKKPAWDSNVITPGTDFMASLSDWLRLYIAERLNNNPAFKNVRVILSDAQSPGEGEHKLIQFIRRQRAEPGYNPNTTHVMYGLDADLIMLGLATHEIHFTILREQVLFGRAAKEAELNKQRNKDQVLLANGTVAGEDVVAGMEDAGMLGPAPKKPFDMVRLWVLREYLAYEFREESFYMPLQFPYNFESCIDDFVFICFFVGNDFLPHLPSLSIKEGGLELLIDLYRRVLPTLRGYLTTDGEVNLSRVDVFVGLLGEVEDEIFERRRRMEDNEKQRKLNMAATRKSGGHNRAMAAAAMESARALAKAGVDSGPNGAAGMKRRKSSQSASEPPPLMADSLVPLGRGRDRAKTVNKVEAPNKDANKSAAEVLRAKLKRGTSHLEGSGDKSDDSQPSKKKVKTKLEEEEEEELELDGAPSAILKPLLKKTRRADPNLKRVGSYEADNSEKAKKEFELREKQLAEARNIHDDVVDEVRLGEAGWKDRYYASKFGKKYHDPKSAERKDVVKEYVKGLCWVMQYYYQGVQSWTWYYPYHYAPFASDLFNLDEIRVHFPPSVPFKPIDQLMGVFPPASAHALPEQCRWYMKDENSPIADFYPIEFKYDPNGKEQRWLWIALLPFIDEKRLLKVTRELESQFSTEALERNELHPDLLFSNVENPGTQSMIKAADNAKKAQKARRKMRKSKDDSGAAQEAGAQAEPEFTPTTAGDARAGADADCAQLLLATDTKGISGYFTHPSKKKFKWKVGEEVVNFTHRHFGEPIHSNKVLGFEFRLPKLRPHLSKILHGVKMPNVELTRYDLDNLRPPRGHRNQAQVGNILIERLGGHPMGQSRGGYGGGPQRGPGMNHFANAMQGGRGNSYNNNGGGRSGGMAYNHREWSGYDGHGGGSYNNRGGSHQRQRYNDNNYQQQQQQYYHGGGPRQFQGQQGGYRSQGYNPREQQGGYRSQGYIPRGEQASRYDQGGNQYHQRQQGHHGHFQQHHQHNRNQHYQQAPPRHYSSGPPQYQGRGGGGNQAGAGGRNALMDSLANALQDRKGGDGGGRGGSSQGRSQGSHPGYYRR